jgi:hypothetical protein
MRVGFVDRRFVRPALADFGARHDMLLSHFFLAGVVLLRLDLVETRDVGVADQADSRPLP